MDTDTTMILVAGVLIYVTLGEPVKKMGEDVNRVTSDTADVYHHFTEAVSSDLDLLDLQKDAGWIMSQLDKL